jgi:hypothetical protein
MDAYLYYRPKNTTPETHFLPQVVEGKCYQARTAKDETTGITVGSRVINVLKKMGFDVK